MKIYHGSPEIVARPELCKGRLHNDYGQGFYCTQDRSLACEWACRLPFEDGFANAYELDTSSLRVLDLDNQPDGVLCWAATLMKHSPVNYVSGVDTGLIDQFINRYAADFSQVDIVEGWRADDSYFNIMRTFASNTISLQRLERALRLGNLGRQIVLKSPCAFEALEFIEADHVDAATWYPLREQRNLKARSEFARSSESDLSGTYFMDILRDL